MFVKRKSGLHTVFLKSEVEGQRTLLVAKAKDNKGKGLDQPVLDC